jgi:hypothetical protein
MLVGTWSETDTGQNKQKGNMGVLNIDATIHL